MSRGAEEAGQPPRLASAPASSRAGIPGQAGAPASQAAPWHPAVQDDEVDAVEREIVDDDLAVPQDPQERARVDNAGRRLADRALLDELIATGFTGPVFEIAVTEFAAYGIATMMAWMRTGEIVKQCKVKGRPLPALGGLVAGQWTRDDRLEIAIETTARALRFFINEVLRPGKWDHRRGATLKTFFVGSCLLQFPNVFDLWAGEQKRWGQVNAAEPATEDATDMLRRDACWSDPTCEIVIRDQITKAALDGIADPRTRSAAHLVMLGYTFAEAGAMVGLSAAAVEGRLYRLRRRSP